MSTAARLVCFLLVLTAAAAAQFTTVSGTITDPNGLPYANGTISAVLVSSASPKFTATNQPYTPPTQPVGLNAAGSFVMQLGDSAALTPAGTAWNFTVNCAAGCVPPVIGKGPVTFMVTGITITGASQSLTATLTAAAPVLAFSSGTPAGGIIILGNPPANITVSNGKCASQLLGSPLIEVYDPSQSTTQLIELLCRSNITNPAFIGFTDYAGANGFSVGNFNTTNASYLLRSLGIGATDQFGICNQVTGSSGDQGCWFLGVGSTTSALDPILFAENAAATATAKIAWGTANCGANVQNNVGMCLQSGSGGIFVNAKVYSGAFHAGAPNSGNVPIDGSFEGLQLNQLATKNFAGTCAMAAATTCTFSVTQGYTSTPICFASVQSAAPTTFQGSCALSGTTVTVTASVANSNTWGALLIGNPN